MMQSTTVALIDWNWMGHHPTYFTHFAAAIVEADAEVVPFCADPDDFLNRLGKTSLSSMVRERVLEPIRVAGPVASRFRPARWRRHYDAFRFFGGLAKQLHAWERQQGRKIDLVFFACIYDCQFDEFRFAERFFGYPWTGLYLHARSFRMPGSPIPYVGGLPCPEHIFSSPLLKAVAVLDEGAVDPLTEITGGKPVLVFPDVTVEELPPGGLDSGLAQKIKAFAAGRPIVSLTGHLQWTKGLDVFTAAAGHPAMQDVFFFLGGEINWMEISPAKKRQMQRAWEELPNIFCYFQCLPEQTMNAVYAASDAVVATYRAFPNSSNALTKAAIFERAIVVSEGYLMAERVRKYHLGEVIPEGNAEALVKAIQRMLLMGYCDGLRDRARWYDYRTIHSLETLKVVMEQLISMP
jgi:glycosyltransferase involved in cell wall biosynthesis